MRKLLCLALALACVLLSAGCWNYKDLEDYAIVAGCAVDRGSGGKYELTVELLDMSSQDGQTTPMLCAAQGDTLFEAVRNMGAWIPQKLYWSNCQLLIMGESLAREEIAPLLDYFIRDHETRPTLQLAIARDTTARALLEHPPEEGIVSFKLGELLENNAQVLATAPQTRLYQALGLLSHPGCALVLPTLTAVSQGEGQVVSTAGAAFLRGDRLAGYLSPRESRGWLLATGRAQGGLLTWNLEGRQGQGVTLELLQARGRVVPDEGDPLSFTVQVTVVASLADSEVEVDLLAQEQLQQLQQEAQQELTQEIQGAFEAGRQAGADLLGLGELLEKRAPNHWKVLREDWAQVYLQSVALEVETEVKLQSGGAVKDSTRMI